MELWQLLPPGEPISQQHPCSPSPSSCPPPFAPPNTLADSLSPFSDSLETPSGEQDFSFSSPLSLLAETWASSCSSPGDCCSEYLSEKNQSPAHFQSISQVLPVSNVFATERGISTERNPAIANGTGVNEPLPASNDPYFVEGTPDLSAFSHQHEGEREPNRLAEATFSFGERSQEVYSGRISACNTPELCNSAPPICPLLELGSHPLRNITLSEKPVTTSRLSQNSILPDDKAASNKENTVQRINCNKGSRTLEQTALSWVQDLQQSFPHREQQVDKRPSGWMCPRSAKKNFRPKPRQVLLDGWLAKQS